MTLKLPTIDFLDNNMSQNTSDSNNAEKIIKSNTSLTKVEEFTKSPKVHNAKLLADKLLAKMSIDPQRAKDNKKYYEKNKTKILLHKATRANTKKELTKTLTKDLQQLLLSLSKDSYLPGAYNISINTKMYNFKGIITFKHKQR